MENLNRKKTLFDNLLHLPSMAWLLIFYALPMLIIFLLTFKPADAFGGIGEGWTLDTLRNLSDPNYPSIIWRTIYLGVISTAVCILVAVPIGYNLARMSQKMRSIVMMLIVVPFWTNFLIRIYAWKVFLHPDGVLKKLLVLIGVAQDNTMLLYNQWAILVVMIYTYLPFAILPIYATAEKFDFSLLDAAKDLGATQLQAFMKVFVPCVSKGIWTAVMVVLIPAFGAYLIPDLVGGPGSELIGDKIAQRVFTERNLPHASGLSAVLMLVVFVPILASFYWKRFHSSMEKKELFK